MDIKNLFKNCLLLVIFLNIHLGLCQDDDYEDGPAFGRCPWIRNKLKNGRVRYRYKGRVAKFLCDSGYELAGKRSSTCVRGQWSNPVPVCVARGCSRVPSIANGRVTEMYRGALLVYDCNPGYTLAGDSSIHCDGRRWNASPPVCGVSTPDPETHCDFESPDLCGWSHDQTHDFDWKRNQFSTPSGHVGTGPSHDHTFGENKAGYYLYIEASSPRKINDTARLFSPVYPADQSGGCFTFWYHMYGATTGGIQVYLKPESHVFGELSPKWGKFGDQGNQWLRGNISVPLLTENFQIVIEGVRGESYVGDSAIDDVQLTKLDCESLENDTEVITESIIADSCRGRCRGLDLRSSCGCNENCLAAENCCNDYHTLCTEGNDTIIQNTDEPLPGDYYGKTTSPITIALTTARTSEPQPTSISSISFLSTTQSTMAAISSTPNQAQTSVITESTSKSSSTSQTIPDTTALSSTPTESTTIKYLSTTTPRLSSQNTITNSLIPITTTRHSITEETSKNIETSTVSTTPRVTQKTTTIPTTSLKTSSPTESTSVSSTNGISGIQTNQAEKSTPPSSSTTETRTSIGTQVYLSSTTISSTETTTALSTTPSTTTQFSSSSRLTTSAPLSITASTSYLTAHTHRYSLRPRKTTIISSSLSTTEKTTAAKEQYFVSSTTAITQKPDVSSLSPAPTGAPQTRRWFTFTGFPTTTTIASIKPTASTVARSSPRFQYVTETSKYPFFTAKPTSHITSIPSTSDSYEMVASKAESAKSSNSTAAVISVVIVVIICVILGGIYYLRKYRGKRQSKLDDDSEMRFLPESDYMEYSDASALDKILIK